MSGDYQQRAANEGAAILFIMVSSLVMFVVLIIADAYEKNKAYEETQRRLNGRFLPHPVNIAPETPKPDPKQSSGMVRRAISFFSSFLPERHYDGPKLKGE